MADKGVQSGIALEDLPGGRFDFRLTVPTPTPEGTHRFALAELQEKFARCLARTRESFVCVTGSLDHRVLGTPEFAAQVEARARAGVSMVFLTGKYILYPGGGREHPLLDVLLRRHDDIDLLANITWLVHFGKRPALHYVMIDFKSTCIEALHTSRETTRYYARYDAPEVAGLLARRLARCIENGFVEPVTEARIRSMAATAVPKDALALVRVPDDVEGRRILSSEEYLAYQGIKDLDELRGFDESDSEAQGWINAHALKKEVQIEDRASELYGELRAQMKDPLKRAVVETLLAEPKEFWRDHSQRFVAYSKHGFVRAWEREPGESADHLDAARPLLLARIGWGEFDFGPGSNLRWIE